MYGVPDDGGAPKYATQPGHDFDFLMQKLRAVHAFASWALEVRSLLLSVHIFSKLVSFRVGLPRFHVRCAFAAPVMMLFYGSRCSDGDVTLLMPSHC